MRISPFDPESFGPPPWATLEVYRTIKHERGATLSWRLWRQYGRDEERARIWFNLHEAVLQNLYEQMITHVVVGRKQSKEFMNILIYNVQQHYDKIDKGTEVIWQKNRTA